MTRPRTAGACIAAVLLSWSAAAAGAASADIADTPGAAQIELGRKVYNFRCYFCHGYSGDANTVAASALQPKPRNFQSVARADLPLPRIIAAVRDGIDRTAMRPFASVLTAAEIDAVARFVDAEFLVRRARNTRYHTIENGWPDHDRYRQAFPFVQGEIPLARPVDALSPEARRGRQMFTMHCITCHDRGDGGTGTTTWFRAN